jgi:hypothetical protein
MIAPIGSRRREEFVHEKQSFVHRFGSGIVALVLPILGLFAEYPIARYLNIDHQITMAVIALVCIGLLAHSWFRQRENCRSLRKLGFWSFALALPLLGALWLGLNSFRGYLYPDFWTDSEIRRYNLVCQLQDWDVRAAVGVAIVTVVWGISLSVATLRRRHLPAVLNDGRN